MSSWPGDGAGEPLPRLVGVAVASIIEAIQPDAAAGDV